MPAPASSLQSSPTFFAITPSDTSALPKGVRQIRCKPISGAGGTVSVLTGDGDTIATEISAGETLALICTKVFATGTTATGLEGWV